jgi:hypothetical protein
MSESKQSPERVDVQGKKVKRIGNFSLAVAAAVLATASGHASTVRPAEGTLLPQDKIGTSQDVPVLPGNFSGPLAFNSKVGSAADCRNYDNNYSQYGNYRQYSNYKEYGNTGGYSQYTNYSQYGNYSEYINQG